LAPLGAAKIEDNDDLRTQTSLLIYSGTEALTSSVSALHVLLARHQSATPRHELRRRQQLGGVGRGGGRGRGGGGGAAAGDESRRAQANIARVQTAV